VLVIIACAYRMSFLCVSRSDTLILTPDLMGDPTSALIK
jgi:hypothetical protein